MSRRGNCWDNAVIENFFKTLKTETIYPFKKRISPEKMRWLISEFMGHYNHDHPYSTNNYLSPNQFEQVRLDEMQEIELSLGAK